jgi:glycosyltransferase involved in cell wall biosynthesis
MRIAMISTPFVPVPPRGYGGTELIVHELTEGLARSGHEVELFGTGDSRTSARLRFLYEQAQWPMHRLKDLNHVSWAMSQVRDFDIVHVHSAEALACSRLIPEIPVVYTLHHVREDVLSDFYRFFPEVHFISISRDQRSREVPLRLGTTIHHGLSPQRYEWTPTPADYVAFVGRFAEIKGVHRAIDAALLANVPIRVAGECHPIDRAYGEREVAPRLALPHVSYLGTVGVEEKVPLLRDARAVLFPISWNEPFGLVLIEAMLSGCPPIAFPRGSVPELVEDGVTGFVVDGIDEMVELLRPGSALDRFDRRRCRERAEQRYGARRMVEEHERYYRSIVRSGIGPPTSDRPVPTWRVSDDLSSVGKRRGT